MSRTLDAMIRGPEAYSYARRALEEMERWGVWPTPLNFELWLHCVSDPDGKLGKEILKIVTAGGPFTEDVAEGLAAEHLPRLRLSDEIQDAGAQLSRELQSFAGAMAQAKRSQEDYGRTLAGASKDLENGADGGTLQDLVSNLTAATQKVQKENSSLEQKLQESTLEVTRLREHLERVRRDAMTDALTQIANRKAFDEGLLRACVESEADGGTVTLAVLDIDHFKRFNDTWGHQTGDQVLRYVASVLSRMAMKPRLAARYGGEEFGIVFPGETADQVEAAMDAVRAEIGSRLLKRRSTNEELGAVTISVGVAERRRGEKPSSLVERADTALYDSKRSGRNRVTNAERVPAAA